MTFLSNGLFWLLFFLLGFSLFIALYGRHSRGFFSPLMMHLGSGGVLIIVVLSFIFMWWQGGVAILVSWVIWAMVYGAFRGLILRQKDKTEMDHEKARKALEIIDAQKMYTNSPSILGDIKEANSPKMFVGIEFAKVTSNPISGNNGLSVSKNSKTKQKTLLNISKRLDPQFSNIMNSSWENLAKASENIHKAEEDLLDYCESKPKIQALMIEFQKSRNDLKELYKWIILQGGGQWMSGHWVPASTIADPKSLRYVLTKKCHDDLRAVTSASDRYTVACLINYFGSGKPLR